MGFLVASLIVLVVLTGWVAATVARLDRLAGRVSAARMSLDAQLVRRAAAAQAIARLVPPPLEHRLRSAARSALDADASRREIAENELSRAIAALPADLDPELLADLADASARVVLARRFYNDAVRDTRALRSRRLARVVTLVFPRPAPAFFEIAETDVGGSVVPALAGTRSA